MRYRSRPVEVEAMQWLGTQAFGDSSANDVVAWVNANGGEARYEPHGYTAPGRRLLDEGTPRIAIRCRRGWSYVKPGDYIVMSNTIFQADPDVAYHDTHQVRRFYRCNPETFERRWELVLESKIASANPFKREWRNAQ